MRMERMPPGFPVVLPSSDEPSTAHGYDGVGPSDSPEHSRAFEPGSKHRLACGFDDS